MIDGVGDHALEETEPVGVSGEGGEAVAEPCAGLAVLFEGEGGGLDGKGGLEAGHAEGRAAFEDGVREWLVAVFEEGGFVVEGFELGEAAAHEETDDPFGAWGEVREGGW